MLIQMSVSEPVVEAFDKGVLSGFAWLHEAKCCFTRLGPEKHGFARELKAVIADNYR